MNTGMEPEKAPFPGDTQKECPEISVVLLTYQRFEHLFDTLETILKQDYPRMSLLISDDGSEVFPQEELLEWLGKNNPRHIPVRIRQNKSNMGLVRHSNLAAQQTEGAFIKFLSPGDGFLSAQSLSRLAAFAVQCPEPMVTSPAKVCTGSFTNVCYVYPSSRRVRMLREKTPRQLFSVLTAANIICAAGMLYRREFFRLGGFDAAYRNLDDWPVWLRRYREGGRIPCFPVPTVSYMLGGMSSASGTAFESLPLRDDLRRCLETEILPYRSELSWWARAAAQYRYSCIVGTPDPHAAVRLAGSFFRLKKWCKRLLLSWHDQGRNKRKFLK